MFSVVRSGATSLFRNASRSVAPQGVSNLACRNFSSGGALVGVYFGRVAKWNAQTLHGGPGKVDDFANIIGGKYKDKTGKIIGETPKQFRMMF